MSYPHYGVALNITNVLSKNGYDNHYKVLLVGDMAEEYYTSITEILKELFHNMIIYNKTAPKDIDVMVVLTKTTKFPKNVHPSIILYNIIVESCDPIYNTKVHKSITQVLPIYNQESFYRGFTIVLDAQSKVVQSDVTYMNLLVNHNDVVNDTNKVIQMLIGGKKAATYRVACIIHITDPKQLYNVILNAKISDAKFICYYDTIIIPNDIKKQIKQLKITMLKVDINDELSAFDAVKYADGIPTVIFMSSSLKFKEKPSIDTDEPQLYINTNKQAEYIAIIPKSILCYDKIFSGAHDRNNLYETLRFYFEHNKITYKSIDVSNYADL